MKSASPLETTTLYLAIGPQQLAALASTGYRCIEPGGRGELLVLFKLTQRYAEMVARQRILPKEGEAWVVRLEVGTAALEGIELSTVAYDEHLEYLVPVASLACLNAQLRGPVAVVSRFLPGESFSLTGGWHFKPGEGKAAENIGLTNFS